MSVAEVGKQLCDLCREGRNLEAVEKLYSEKIVSVEAASGPELPQVMEGIDAVRGKNEWWFANHEIHGGDVKGPFPHGEDRFAAHFTMDVTGKADGHRMEFEEVAIYTVSDGKIVREEFFYAMPG